MIVYWMFLPLINNYIFFKILCFLIFYIILFVRSFENILIKGRRHHWLGAHNHSAVRVRLSSVCHTYCDTGVHVKFKHFADYLAILSTISILSNDPALSLYKALQSLREYVFHFLGNNRKICNMTLSRIKKCNIFIFLNPFLQRLFTFLKSLLMLYHLCE